MPNRIIRDWTDSDAFDGISPEAERLFIRLIMKVDDYGRFHAEARRVKAACFPLIQNLRPTDIDGWLRELAERHLILRYRVEDRDLLSIPRFRQRLKHSIPKFPPAPGEPDTWLPDSGNFPELPGTSRNFPPEAETETETYNPPTPLRGGGSGFSLRSPDGNAAAAASKPPPLAGKPPKAMAASPPNGGETAEFLRFWGAWPEHHRKANRKKCFSVWKNSKCDAIAGTVVAAVEAWKCSEEWRKDDGRFISAPLVFLNQRVWEAPPPKPAKSTQSTILRLTGTPPPPEPVRHKTPEELNAYRRMTGRKPFDFSANEKGKTA